MTNSFTLGPRYGVNDFALDKGFRGRAKLGQLEIKSYKFDVIKSNPYIQKLFVQDTISLSKEMADMPAKLADYVQAGEAPDNEMALDALCLLACEFGSDEDVGLRLKAIHGLRDCLGWSEITEEEKTIIIKHLKYVENHDSYVLPKTSNPTDETPCKLAGELIKKHKRPAEQKTKPKPQRFHRYG